MSLGGIVWAFWSLERHGWVEGIASLSVQRSDLSINTY